MQFQQQPNQTWYGQLRGLRNGFIAGLIVGMLIGWFFHGLVGLAVRLGFALLLLIPLAIVIWFFFLRRRGGPTSETGSGPGGMQVFTWGSGQGSRRYTTDPRRQPPGSAQRTDRPPDRLSENEIIDLEFEELKRRDDDEDRRP